VKELSLITCEWRYSPATRSTGFVGENFGHITCTSW
jgi:hypothetical protein